MKLLKACAALAAVLVFGAIGSSSASAKEFHVTAPGTTLTGVAGELPVFTQEGSSFSCSQVNFTGTAPAPGYSAPTQAFYPSYSKCNMFGQPISVNTWECRYNFDASTGAIELFGCSGGAISFKWVTGLGECSFRIPNQTVKGASYVNNVEYVNGVKYETYTITLSSLFKSEVTVSTGVCPFTKGNTTIELHQAMKVSPATGQTWVA